MAFETEINWLAGPCPGPASLALLDSSTIWSGTKFLLVTLGSVGDILPLLGVAVTLRQRRHRVIIASNAGYGPLGRASGFEFAAIWQREQQSLASI